MRELIDAIVEHIVMYNMPDKNGVTKRDSLLQVIDSAPENSPLYASALAELEDEKQPPFYLEHIFDWFWELHRKRTYGFSAPNPISNQEILAWMQLTGTQVRPLEIEIINTIDAAYLKYIEKHKPKDK